MNENNYVVKANQFIEAKGRLGIIEQKLLLCLISEIKPSDKDFKTYHLRIKDLAEFAQLDYDAAYKVLSDSADELMGKILNFEEKDPNGGEPTFVKVHLVSSARHKKGSGEIIVRFDPELKPYLLAIQGHKTPFTKYMIKNILKLHSVHAIRLYELLKRHESKWSAVKNYNLKELKEKMGIDKNAYKAAYDFDRKVLKPAKKEINTHTDIIIDYKKIKKGRRIAEIEFTVHPKYTDEEAEKHKKFKKTGVFDYDGIRENTGLQDEYFSDKQIAELYEIACKVTERFNGDPEIYIAMTYAYSKIRKPKAMFAYLKKALEENFVNHYESVSDNDYENNHEEPEKSEQELKEEELEGQLGLDELQHLRTQRREKEGKGE